MTLPVSGPVSGPPAEAEPPPADEDQPLRVSTLELFFNLVFVFAITQLTSILARDMTLAAGLRVLLIFGVLWWMYGGYVWLTNARAPSRTPKRLLVIIVFGESVADIGIGIGTAGHAVTVSLAVSATLGLALAAALWWTYFGVGDDERAEQALTQADPAARAAAAVVSVAASAVGVTVSVAVEIAVLALIVAAALVVEPKPASTVEP